MPQQHNGYQQCGGCNRPIQPMQPFEWWGQSAVCLPCYRAYSQHQSAAVAEPDPLAQISAGSGAAAAYRPSRRAPDYPWIRVGAGVLAVIGGLSILAGLFMFGGAILANKKSDEATEVRGIMAAAGVVWGLTLIAYGILSFFVASVGMAIRDIARNSFRW